ncbi:MAG: glycerol kinase GlpK [Phycisphaeraceae bacterium]|nr:glycerol kinase GlpK [Phycisphaeraceae bacterium]
MKHILALDQGTTSSRAIVFDPEGRIKGMAGQELTQHYPRPGWVEHDPEEIWTSQLATARQAIERSGVGIDAIAAIGITNQRETTVLWERATGRPVGRAIVWQDRRTSGMCDQLRRRGIDELVQERSGLVLDAYFSATKLMWMLEHIEGARQRAQAGELCFGTVESWLVWNLTGGAEHITDITNASRTMLMHLETGQWDERLLDALDIPAKLLPRIVPNSGELAHAETEHFGRRVLIGGLAGDQQAALFGQACFEPGLAKNTYGTGCFMLMQVGGQPAQSTHRLLSTQAWRLADRSSYALEGSVFIGGAVVQWLRDGLGLIRQASEIEELASSVKDSEGVFLVPAFAGLGAPYWDQYARGIIAGLTRGTTAAHLARAALDGIAFQVADVLEVMSRDSGRAMTELRVDGGASANNLLLQIQADLLGVPVVRPEVTETTALGAAMFAGLARGVWKDQAHLASMWRKERVFEPRISRDEAADRRAKWTRALERAMDWEQPD